MLLHDGLWLKQKKNGALFEFMAVFYGYVAPATRAVVAASQYNEYVLRVLLFCTHWFAGFLTLALKVNGYFRWTLKRLPLGASEDLTRQGGGSSTRLHLHLPTLKGNGWKCLQWYRSWKHLDYSHYNRVHSVLRTVLELFSRSLAAYCAVVAHVQLALGVLLKVCRCLKVLCMAADGRLGPIGSSTAKG